MANKGPIRQPAFMPEKWHRCDDPEEAADNLLRAGTLAIEKASPRRGEARLFASLHEGLELTSFDGSGYRYDNNEVFEHISMPIIKNTVRSIVMTQVALLTSNDTPLAQFMTNEGGWEEQTKAVRMGRLVDVEVEQPQGHFASLHELHRHGATIAIAATGSYMVFYFPGDNGVRAELDDTLTVGIEQAGRFGRVTSVVRTVWYDADDLAADFSDFETEIFANETMHQDQWVSTDIESDVRPRRGVKVVQGWHMAYKDVIGREMWVLQDGTILKNDEKYERKTPPYVKWDYERQLYGLWGVPLTRSIYEMAMRENRMLCDMDNAERNSPQCVMVLPENAEKPGDLDEARGWTIIRTLVDPSKIHFATPPKYNQMTADFVDRMQAGCQAVSGVDAQHSSATKAVGTTSGKHEHLVAALHTERFADQERRLIQVRAVDNAKEIVYAMKIVVEEQPDFERIWSRGDKTERIKPKDLDLDVSKYSITVAPVSEDKDTPAARMDKAQDWLDRGLITGTEFAALQQTYATNSKSSELLAQEEWLEKQIDKWLHADDEARLDENFYQGPERWDDLTAELRQVSQAKKQARSRGAPSDVIEWFDKFLAEASDYMDQQTAAQNTTIKATAPASSIFPGVADQQPAPAPAPGAGGPTQGVA